GSAIRAYGAGSPRPSRPERYRRAGRGASLPLRARPRPGDAPL
ncbi:MAG: hypothetical protein AVDCRST_MAG88-4723, partial [uncultured Thermomicrobiales bacterium]